MQGAGGLFSQLSPLVMRALKGNYHLVLPLRGTSLHILNVK